MIISCSVGFFLRWQTSNSLTTISALYPTCFGECVAFAHHRAYHRTETENEMSIDDFVNFLLKRGFKPVSELIKEAQDLFICL